MSRSLKADGTEDSTALDSGLCTPMNNTLALASIYSKPNV